MYLKLRATDKLLQILQRLETLDSWQGEGGGGVKLTRKASETRLAAPEEEVASPYSPCLWFRSGSTREDVTSLTIACMENTGILLEASKEIGLEVNPEKTKYMIMSRDENIVRNGNIKTGNLSFEDVEKFKYLRTTVTNINDTREEIKHGINMGNACYYSVENLLSSSLLSKNLKVRIYKTVILPVVLYGCETWTLTLREEHGLRVFENKVLRKIFGAKRDEVTGEWRKLHNTELHALYSSPDILRNIKSRRLRWAGHVARMGESRNAYRVLVGRPEGKRSLGRPRRRWEDNIKMDLREVGYDDREWINLAKDRDRWRGYVRAAMNFGFLKSHLSDRPRRGAPLGLRIFQLSGADGDDLLPALIRYIKSLVLAIKLLHKTRNKHEISLLDSQSFVTTQPNLRPWKDWLSYASRRKCA
ncbi:hypothetical protein ANN_07307 [Periplaneta americana]|uniref:Reverse transcriptase n=1 Tax=Periplaneta americana TaxID=6978 RepID=A0ABQ8SZS9_PERAM|nr:hypothetical protein ANN_07307 [Periplaneta americana]